MHHHACSIHELQSFGIASVAQTHQTLSVSWWDSQKAKAGSTFPYFLQPESLCVDGFYIAGGKFRDPGFTLSRRAADSAFPKCEAEDSGEAGALVALLKACTKNKDLHRGAKIHDDILKRGLLEECSNALITMYAKCGELGKAEALLGIHKSRDTITWTALITGYVREGQGQNALDCFECMCHSGILPDVVTYVCILKACAIVGAANRGKNIHDEIARQGLLQDNIVLGTALVHMYAKCGALSNAQKVLEELPSRDVVSWSALISGYAQEGQAERAFECFEKMQRDGVLPNEATYICVLKACASFTALDKGQKLHMELVRQGLLQNNVVLGTALVHMYTKCHCLQQAQRVLEELPSRDVVSWSALIAGYTQECQGEQALKCLEQMERDGILPDAVTYGCILKACATIGDIDKGQEVHDKVSRQGLLQTNILLANSLVDMYVKCGALSKAQHVLEELPSRDVVSWNALIAGYAHEGQGEQALNCFEEMQCEDILPDAVTYTSVLKACATIAASNKGKEIHGKIRRKGLLYNNVVLGTALIEMYAKCGEVAEAQRVLEELPCRNVATWSALIAGYTREGQAEPAFDSFEQMQVDGILPDAVTFVCILNLCSHLGLLEEGHAHFINMSTNYGLKPNLGCYTCMVDLFVRAGHLEEALKLVQEMRSPHFLAICLALMGACRRWGDVNVGRWAFECAVQVDISDTSAYIQMANIYAATDDLL